MREPLGIALPSFCAVTDNECKTRAKHFEEVRLEKTSIVLNDFIM
jgi:hypothetical protein